MSKRTEGFFARPTSRSMAPEEKILRMALGVGVLLIVVLLAFGCVPHGYVEAQAIQPTVEALIERHDGYVRIDSSISPERKATHFRDGELLLKLLDEAQKED